MVPDKALRQCIKVKVGSRHHPFIIMDNLKNVPTNWFLV